MLAPDVEQQLPLPVVEAATVLVYLCERSTIAPITLRKDAMGSGMVEHSQGRAGAGAVGHRID